MAFAIELKDITKTYGNKNALDNVSLRIHNGEILALLGPNGSGKTTLLKILAFIEDPTRGEIRFSGEPVTSRNVERMRLLSTLVFQKTTVFSTSVYNNVAYGLKIRRLPKETRDEEVTKALTLVKLEGFENRPARKLSGGEQQRVAIARALVLKTKLLLLDEPTANLDPKSATLIEDVISTVNRDTKTTVVMATHNMFQAKTLPHRIALISEGRITEIGPPSDIFSRLSKNLVSFAAIGNTFTGSATLTGKGTTIVDIGNNVRIETTSKKSGAVTVFINPQDIILSNTAITSSARNVFTGRITRITDFDELVRLEVDVGRPFTVQITKRSFSEMKLSLSDEVFIAFKASNVQVL
jgi:tungstate transport system ATP-binding protein